MLWEKFILIYFLGSQNETNLCLWITYGPFSLQEIITGLSNVTATIVATTPWNISTSSYLFWAET